MKLHEKKISELQETTTFDCSKGVIHPYKLKEWAIAVVKSNRKVEEIIKRNNKKERMKHYDLLVSYPQNKCAEPFLIDRFEIKESDLK